MERTIPNALNDFHNSIFKPGMEELHGKLDEITTKANNADTRIYGTKKDLSDLRIILQEADKHINNKVDILGSAINKTISNKDQRVVISKTFQDEITRIIDQAEKFRQGDNKRKELAELKNNDEVRRNYIAL